MMVSNAINDEVAYQKAKRIGAICKEAETLSEAKMKAKNEFPEENLDDVVKAVGYWLK